MHKRLKKQLIMLAAVLSAGVIYYLITTTTGLIIPCVFHYVTGFYCPGCGVTRMCISIIKLDFYKAFRSNPLLFVLLPVLAAIMLKQSYDNVRYGKLRHKKFMTVIGIILIIILLIFGILRNIPAFYYLKPL